jgi:predicted anti-sigma-YlaC factor YlaD
VSTMRSGHVSSDRLGEAAQHASLDSLRVAEKAHVEGCDKCKELYASYRLTDRLLAASWRQAAVPAAVLEQKRIRTGPLRLPRWL